MENKLEWSSFEPLFGDFAPKMKIFFDNGGFEPIYTQLKAQSARNIRIAPKSSDVFNCFLKCPANDLKLAIIGWCPYHTLRLNKETNKLEPIADGICMSTSNQDFLQPSLSQWYDELERVYNSKSSRNPNLEFMSKQGILMFNAGLTVVKDKAGSHNSLWEQFTIFVIENIIAPANIPVIFLGKEAAKFSKYLLPMQWYWPLLHPASSSYKGENWSSNGAFKQIDKVLMDVNGETINWLGIEQPKVQEQKVEKEEVIDIDSCPF